MSVINIARDFSDTPGTRYEKDGPFSGERFREEILVPAYRRLEGPKQIVVELDGVEGYPASFLEEAFGGFARLFGRKEASRVLDFRSVDSTLITEIREYVEDAEKGQ